MPVRKSLKQSKPTDFEPKRKNPISLGSDSNIDNDFKPLKIGGKNTGLEFADNKILSSAEEFVTLKERTEHLKVSKITGNKSAGFYSPQIIIQSDSATDSESGLWFNVFTSGSTFIKTGGDYSQLSLQSPTSIYNTCGNDTSYGFVWWKGDFGAGTNVTVANLHSGGQLKLSEASNAVADVAGYGQIWVKDESPNELYFTNDAGNDIQLTSGSGIATISDEAIQDKVGAMFSSNTETLITATYQDADGTIDLVVDNDLSNYDNSSSGFITATLTNEQVQDIVGAMFTSNTETRISATYQDGDGTIDLAVDDMTANDNTTYAISCVDGDNSDEEKIRLTAGGSGSGTDDVVLEAGTGLSIARDGDKITFTNTVTDTDTVLTSEQVQDIVGAMFTSNTETRISATYEDGDGTIDLVVDDMTADTNTNQLTTFVVEDGDGTEVTISQDKEWKFVEGTGIDIDWTDVDNGTDADPYDLTITCNLEGTELASTGETGGNKYLREDGDGTCSWQTVSASGNFLADNADDTMEGTLTIDKNNSTASNGTTKGLFVDVDRTGNVSSGVDYVYGLDVDLDVSGSSNHVQLIYGIECAVTADDMGSGSSQAIGLSLSATGADTNIGINNNTADGGTDYKQVSSADTDDYFSMVTTTNGATTLATVDDGGATAHLTLDPDGDLIISGADTKIDATKKLYLDGGTDSYIHESSADVLQIYAGGDKIVEMTEATTGNKTDFGTTGVGFTQFEPTYNASDTNVNFNDYGNKAFVTFGSGNITDMNLYFPDVSCNCTLLLKQDGSGSRTVTNWKTFDQADGNESTVVWSGGSAPTLTTTANKLDIISFYWDNDNHKAYGVASLNF